MLTIGSFVIWKCVGGAYIRVLLFCVMFLYVLALFSSVISGVLSISAGSFAMFCCSVCVCGNMFSPCVFV